MEYVAKKSRERVKKYGEVFTPPWVVEKMLDYLEQENGDDVFRPGSTIGDLTGCGSGNFLAAILTRKLKNCFGPEDILISLGSIYGIDIQEDNVLESRERLLGMVKDRLSPFDYSQAEAIVKHNIVAGNFMTKKLNTGEPISFLE